MRRGRSLRSHFGSGGARVLRMFFRRALSCLAAPLLVACGSSSAPSPSSTPQKSDAEYQTSVIDDLHALFLGDIQALLAAAKDLADALPATKGRGWEDAADGPALAKAED